MRRRCRLDAGEVIIASSFLYSAWPSEMYLANLFQERGAFDRMLELAEDCSEHL